MKGKKKTLNLSNRLLDDIAVAMNDNSYEMTWYLDLQKEETIFTMEYDAADDDESQAMIENDLTGERYISIPAMASHEGWDQMERFILNLDDQDIKTKNLLYTIIQGRGAFGRFKEAIFNIGLRDRWFVFKNLEDRKEVLDWLLSNDLITSNDIEKGIQLYEEGVAKGKQREMDIANMIKGTQVKCIENAGHEERTTLGAIYEVLDEKAEHLNIRLRDDRGMVRWYPKSHFELIKSH
jgi:hypothetical protein